MRRPLLVAGATWLAMVTVQVPRPQVFRSTTDGVIIDVAVLDGRKPIAGLVKNDFELRDNGVLQTVLDASSEPLPLDVTFTIDVSGSVSPVQRAQQRQAIQDVVATLVPSDRYRLLTFSTRAHEGVAWSTPATAVALAAMDVPPDMKSPCTALFDAAALTVLTVPEPGRRQLALVLTDGLENSSFLDHRGLLDAMKYTDTVAHVIITNPKTLPTGHSAHARALESVASETGGHFVEIGTNRNIGAAFLAAVDEFRASYVLRYMPKNVPPPAGWHDVTVKVKSGKYTVRARKGYVVTPPPDKRTK